MTMEVLNSSGNVLRVKLKGEMNLAAFEEVSMVATGGIKRLGKIKFLIIVEDFQGWEGGVDWGDISFMLEHDKNIEKMALVGDPSLKDQLFAFAAKSLRTTPIEFFERSRLADAEAWLETDEAVEE